MPLRARRPRDSRACLMWPLEKSSRMGWTMQWRLGLGLGLVRNGGLKMRDEEEREGIA